MYGEISQTVEKWCVRDTQQPNPVFANEIEKSGAKIKLRKVSIQKRYVTADQKWKSTNSYDVNDLPKLKLVADEAYRYLALCQGDGAVESAENGKSG